MPSSRRSSQKKDTDKGTLDADTLPPSLRPLTDTPPIHTDAGSFDIDEPELPDWVAKHALASGGYPYSDPMDKKRYERETKGLQVELVKLQKHVGQSGLRIVVVFEGRDAAGKGGTIATFRRYLNPRGARLVALTKPTEAERTQWFFQRYIGHLPIAGEMVLFDRSWYNRAGVEPVMGFCTPEEHRIFLDQAPVIEASFAEQGIILFKFWLDIGREMQLKRFHSRRHDPLKVWKLSPIDYEAMLRWDAYSEARDRMLAETHTLAAPWTVVRANDKRRARLSVMRHVLARLDYPGRDGGLVDDIDPAVIGSGPDFLAAGR